MRVTLVNLNVSLIESISYNHDEPIWLNLSARRKWPFGK